MYIYIYIYNIYIYIYTSSNPAPEAALQPLTRCSESLPSHPSSRPEVCFFRHRLAPPPRHAPPRPDPPVVCSGFEFDRCIIASFKPVESKIRTYHRRIGAKRRTSGQQGGDLLTT